jgi:hypothetical protein
VSYGTGLGLWKIVGDGLDVGDDVGCRFFVVSDERHVVKHDADAGSRWRWKFGDGCEGAVSGVNDDLVDHLRNVFVVLAVDYRVGACDRGQVAAGDLEAVEEESGAFGVDLVAGDALENLADGELDGGAVVGEGDVEASAAAFAFVRIFDGAAGCVMVVAEVFVAEAWAAAAVAVGEDVAALETYGFGGNWLGHVVSPLDTYWL